MKRGLVSWALAGTAACASLMNVCALLFSCGCRSWWTGAAIACNIHHAGMRHCPWCALDPTLFWSLFGGFVLVQGVAVLLLRQRPWWAQTATAVATFLAAAAVSAGVLGWRSGYWA